MGNAAVASLIADDHLEVYRIVGRPGARTEHFRVGSRSVEAPIEGGESPGDQLHLGAADGAVPGRQIRHDRARKVLCIDHVEQSASLARHQAERAPHEGRVGREIDILQAGLVGGHVLGREHLNPGSTGLGASRPGA